MKKIPAVKPAKKRGGRPSQAQAARLRDKILDAAADVFFTEGYGAATIEAVARRAKIAKRTLYARFDDKADLFTAVVYYVIEKLRPPNAEKMLQGSGQELLQRLAEVILTASLTPQSLALHRLIISEATRFPELADTMHKVGAREEAVKFISTLLINDPALGKLKPDRAQFAAEQFLQMIVSVPQRRALGLGTPMTTQELKDWARDATVLFLNGCLHAKA